MVEFVAGLGAILGATATTGTAAAGTAAVGATAAAAGTAAVGAGSIFSTASILSGVATAFSAASAIGAGIAAGRQKRAEAEALELEADNERLVGATEGARLRRSLSQTIQQQAIAFAASGVDVTGSPQIAARQALEQGERAISTARTNSDLRLLSLRRRRRALLSGAKLDPIIGGIKGLGAIFNTGAQIGNRG